MTATPVRRVSARVSPGFVPVFSWKISSLIKHISSAEQEVGGNGNSSPEAGQHLGKVDT